MEFSHVSGDYWLATVTAMGMTVPFAAKFAIGVDGNPASVEVDYTVPPLAWMRELFCSRESNDCTAECF